MDQVKIIWKTEQGNELKELYNLKDDGYIYELVVDSPSVLDCDVDVLTNVISDSIEIGGFDVLILDDFFLFALLKKIVPEGLPTYVVKPPLFSVDRDCTHVSKTRTNTKSGRTVASRKALKKTYEVKPEHAAAIALFSVLVIGLFAYGATSNNKKKS
jgi:hypothetical protein